MAELRRIALLARGASRYEQAVLRGVGRYARTGRRWLFQQCDPAPRMLDLVRRWRPHGIIGYLRTAELIRAVRRMNVPAVNISRIFSDPRVPTVGPDSAMIGQIAADHLLERGFRHFAFFGDAADYSRRRQEAFAAAVNAKGFECEVHIERGLARRQPVPMLVQRLGRLPRWISSLPRPVGLLCSNDVRALLASEICRQEGIAVPDEIALIGVDNDEMVCDLSQPPLSSIDTGGEVIGYEAAAILDRLLCGASAPSSPCNISPLGVVTRQSTDVVAVDDSDLSAAIRFIRGNADRPIDVGDVLRAVPLSRRMLERRIREMLGRSPLAEIRRVHVERGKMLLANTDLAIPDVARRSGFNSAERFSVVFRQETDTTPTAYRRQFRLGVSRASAEI